MLFFAKNLSFIFHAINLRVWFTDAKQVRAQYNGAALIPRYAADPFQL